MTDQFTRSIPRAAGGPLRPRSFEGIWIPIVTPFHRGAVDHPGLARLARQLAASGIAGIVACATTGEAATLDEAEQEAVFRTLRETLGADYPLVMGLAGCDTRAMVDSARRMARWQPAGLLVTAPYYLRPAQAGLRRHFEAIADAAALPLLLYDIPYRTGVTIELPTLQALAEHPLIQAIKLCPAGDLGRLEAVIAETPLSVLVGDDSMIFAGLCLGARGAISAAAHLRPELYVRMRQLIATGEIAAARHIALALRPLIRQLFAEPNPAPIKACLAARALIADELRLPLTSAGAALRPQLRDALATLEQACGA